jgi:serine protease inhibitor
LPFYTDKFEIIFTHGILLKKGYTFVQKFVDEAKSTFGKNVYIKEVDFTKANTRKKINAWAKKCSHKMIKNLIPCKCELIEFNLTLTAAFGIL